MTDVDRWDPDPHEKEWYREVVSGQRGWKVIRNGEPRIRLDYKEDIHKKLSAEWTPDNEKRDMTPAQVAQVCFEADKKLCFFIGLPENSRKLWIDLHEEKRRQWIEAGPTAHPLRRAVNQAIREAIMKHIEGAQSTE